MSKKIKKNAAMLPSYVFIVIVCLVILVPIAILLLASFKANVEFANSGIFDLPESLLIDNYLTVFKRGNFLTAFKNTAIILICATVINVILGSMLAFVIGCFDFKAKGLILLLVMGARVIPTITTQVAKFTIIKWLGLYDTLGAPILLYAGADVVQVLLYLQFVKSIPFSLIESARIDGASYFRIYSTVVFPLLKPATLTVVILKIVNIYNDMYVPYLYLPSRDNAVISTAIMKFCSSNYGSQIPMLAATFIIVMLPMLILYICTQKLLFGGITSGAVKE